MNSPGSHESAKTSKYNTNYFAVLYVAGATHNISTVI